jgi:hypothetical protein
MKAQQDAYKTREDVIQARLETRRQQFDLDNYIRGNTPTPEMVRQQRRLERWRGALNDPPVTEIRSGRALNEVLDLLQVVRDHNIGALNLTVPQDALGRINVTCGAAPSIGLLRKRRPAGLAGSLVH